MKHEVKDIICPPEHVFENHPAKRLYIETVPNCVLTRSCLVFTIRGVHSACLFDGLSLRRRAEMNLVGFGSIIKHNLSWLESGPEYFHILNVWGTGYHHWLTEVAPKLFIFEAEIRAGKILLPENCPKFIFEFLEHFAFDNFVLFPGNAFVKELNVISNPNSGHYNPAHILPFRDRVLSSFRIENGENQRKIYVSRRNSRGRKVLNDNEVERVLMENGFESVELESTSFAEQVRLFANCESLVSIHGAALTNMLFMPPGSQVIEFYPRGFTEREFFNACYLRLSKILGLNHRYLFSERECPSGKLSLHNDNLLVNKQNLEELIKTQLKNQKCIL